MTVYFHSTEADRLAESIARNQEIITRLLDLSENKSTDPSLPPCRTGLAPSLQGVHRWIRPQPTPLELLARFLSKAMRRFLNGSLLARQRPDGHLGGQAPRGAPISHSWPNGSRIRPSRQPCSSPTGDVSVAPAATARRTTASGSSTTSVVRPVAPSISRGLRRFMVDDAGAIQTARHRPRVARRCRPLRRRNEAPSRRTPPHRTEAPRPVGRPTTAAGCSSSRLPLVGSRRTITARTRLAERCRTCDGRRDADSTFARTLPMSGSTLGA